MSDWFDNFVAVYQGREYRAATHDAAWVELVSRNADDLQWGFTLYAPEVLVKKVPRSAVSAIYSVRHYGLVHGTCVELLGVRDGLYHAWSSQEVPGFDEVDRQVWERWLRPEELERIWEERTEL